MILLMKVITLVFVAAGASFALYGGWKTYGAVREEHDPRFEDGDRRSRYFVFPARFVAITVAGIAFIVIPLLVYDVGVRALDTPAGAELTAEMEGVFAELLEWRVGPLSVLHMFYGFAGLFAVALLLSVLGKIFKR